MTYIPLDTKTSVRTTAKLNKYKDLEIEVERLWGIKTTTVPVVMGTLGTIKKDSPPSQAVTLHHVETLFASQSPWFGFGC